MLLHILLFFLVAVYFIEQYIGTLTLKVPTWDKIQNVKRCNKGTVGRKQLSFRKKLEPGIKSAITTFSPSMSAHRFPSQDLQVFLFIHPLAGQTANSQLHLELFYSRDQGLLICYVSAWVRVTLVKGLLVNKFMKNRLSRHLKKYPL